MSKQLADFKVCSSEQLAKNWGRNSYNELSINLQIDRRESFTVVWREIIGVNYANVESMMRAFVSLVEIVKKLLLSTDWKWAAFGQNLGDY